MSLLLGEFDTLDEAWMAALGAVNPARDGRAINLALSIRYPSAGHSDRVEAELDSVLASHGKHSVRTVANTLFPSRLYRSPADDWRVGMGEEELRPIEDAANNLFERYLEMLPTLMTLPANSAGTYFSRMITWPGKPGGVNQLERRIHFLRVARENGRAAHSASDIQIDTVPGIEIYAATDERQEGFPCLSHISLTAMDGRLSMNAVYRHWHLITRAYGNLIGLSELLAFLAQQSGFEVGELMVTATKANTERNPYSKHGVDELTSAVSAIDRE